MIYETIKLLWFSVKNLSFKCATNLLCFRLHALTTTAEQSLTWELLSVNKTKTIKSRTKSFTHTAVELRIWHGSKVHLLWHLD